MTTFDLIEISKKNSPFTEIEVWLGVKNKVKAYINQDLYKIIPKARKKHLKAVVTYDGPIEAPIKKNDVIGMLDISYKDNVIGKYKLLALEDVDRVNIFLRLIKSINYLIWGDV
jgi:D-alanyl-D-alanine carboxypeptidase (penicillin-binding protein 5/6)